jgi:HlyD family secretion protein
MRKLFNLSSVLLFILLPVFFISCRKPSKNSETIEASGLIEAVETEIRAKVQGEVKEIHVQEGDKIKKGDLLCLQDDEKLLIQLNQVRAALEGARSKLELFKKGTKKELIAVAKNQVEEAGKELELAQKNEQRLAKLLSEGAISEAQKEQADLKLKAAQEGHKSAMENYQLLLRGKEKEEIEMVEAEKSGLQAQEQFLQSQIQDTKVVSPVDGFLEIKHIEKGELALPGTLLFSLIDLNQTYVNAYLPERYIGWVKIGSSVEVISDSFPQKVFKGQVDYISDQAEFAPKNIQTKEERLKLVFRIKSYLQNTEGELKPGMPVDVKIIIDSVTSRKSPSK